MFSLPLSLPFLPFRAIAPAHRDTESSEWASDGGGGVREREERKKFKTLLPPPLHALVHRGMETRSTRHWQTWILEDVAESSRQLVLPLTASPFSWQLQAACEKGERVF